MTAIRWRGQGSFSAEYSKHPKKLVPWVSLLRRRREVSGHLFSLKSVQVHRDDLYRNDTFPWFTLPSSDTVSPKWILPLLQAPAPVAQCDQGDGPAALCVCQQFTANSLPRTRWVIRITPFSWTWGLLPLSIPTKSQCGPANTMKISISVV